jgi:hypothetical protein
MTAYSNEFSIYYSYDDDLDETNVLTNLISNIEIEEDEEDDYFDDGEMGILYQQCTL